MTTGGRNTVSRLDRTTDDLRVETITPLLQKLIFASAETSLASSLGPSASGDSWLFRPYLTWPAKLGDQANGCGAESARRWEWSE